MSTLADARPRRARPSLPVRLLHLAALSAAVVAAPLLLPMGDHPAFFAAFGAGGRDIWIVAVLVLVVPPLVLWLPGVVAHLIDRRAGWIGHLLPLGVLGGVGGPPLPGALDPGPPPARLLAPPPPARV